jgi:hypothetical protein
MALAVGRVDVLAPTIRGAFQQVNIVFDFFIHDAITSNSANMPRIKQPSAIASNIILVVHMVILPFSNVSIAKDPLISGQWRFIASGVDYISLLSVFS